MKSENTPVFLGSLTATFLNVNISYIIGSMVQQLEIFIRTDVGKQASHTQSLPSNPFHYESQESQGISTCKVVFIREPTHGSIGLHQYGMQYYCQSVSGAQ